MDSKKLSIKLRLIRRNFSIWFDWGITMFMKFLYHGGIPLSFIYGKFAHFTHFTFRTFNQASNFNVCFLHSYGKSNGHRKNGYGRSTRRNDVTKNKIRRIKTFNNLIIYSIFHDIFHVAAPVKGDSKKLSSSSTSSSAIASLF